MCVVQYKNIITMVYYMKFKIIVVLLLKKQFFWVVVLCWLVSSSFWTA